MRIFTRHNRKNLDKKSSLNLSINAIVILILAIAMLGLGLGFIKKVFEPLDPEKIGRGTELPNPPDSQNPVTISPAYVSVAQGKTESYRIGFYNKEANDVQCLLTIYDSNGVPCDYEGNTEQPGSACDFGSNGDVWFHYRGNPNANPVSVAPGETVDWTLIIKEPSTKDIAFYTMEVDCSINGGGTYQADFTLSSEG